MLKHIAHVGVTVSNLERSIDFYQKCKDLVRVRMFILKILMGFY